MSSRIEQIIEEIEEYVESCKYQPLSTTKIVVNKEELEELLRELRLKTPDEIKRYQKIISNKDAILADAQNKADAIIAEAQAKAREMVEQSEVMQSAYAQANETVNNANQQAQEILDAATNDANSIRLGAIGYTDDMLANLSNIMTTALNDAGEKDNSFPRRVLRKKSSQRKKLSYRNMIRHQKRKAKRNKPSVPAKAAQQSFPAR